jgi:chlorophyll synthase
MTLNDFKSVVGDRRCGVRSLPVQLGAPGRRARRAR